MANNNTLMVLLLVVAGVFAYNQGWLNFGGQGDVADNLPSDLKTTITLNTGDELATSATNANVSYYVFSSDGAYLREGTTSAGTASFDVPVNGNYALILYADTGSTDYIAKEVSFSTTDGKATKTINVDLMKESAATINDVRDPLDLDSNITRTAGSTVSFDILYSATTSNAALNKPIIVVQVNETTVDEVSVSGYSLVDCPRRLSVSTGTTLYCFASSAVVKSSDGIQTAKANMLLNGVTAPAAGSTATITVIDSGIYRESNYKTAGKSAFKYGAENPVDRTNVGAADSSTDTIVFN